MWADVFLYDWAALCVCVFHHIAKHTHSETADSTRMPPKVWNNIERCREIQAAASVSVKLSAKSHRSTLSPRLFLFHCPNTLTFAFFTHGQLDPFFSSYLRYSFVLKWIIFMFLPVHTVPNSSGSQTVVLGYPPWWCDKIFCKQLV